MARCLSPWPETGSKVPYAGFPKEDALPIQPEAANQARCLKLNGKFILMVFELYLARVKKKRGNAHKA